METSRLCVDAESAKPPVRVLAYRESESSGTELAMCDVTVPCKKQGGEVGLVDDVAERIDIEASGVRCQENERKEKSHGSLKMGYLRS